MELALESVVLHPRDHVGVFYRGDEERDAFVLPLISTALRSKCGVIYVCDRSDPEQVGKQLQAASADVDDALDSGQLRLVAGLHRRLPRHRLLRPAGDRRVLQQAAEGSLGRGYPMLCVVGEMSWSLRGCPGTQRLIEYEALYAQEFGATPAITLCLYDPRADPRRADLRPARLHGRVVLNGIEMLSPHVDPAFFLDGREPALSAGHPTPRAMRSILRPLDAETSEGERLQETVAGLHAVVMLGSFMHAVPDPENTAELAAGGLAALTRLPLVAVAWYADGPDSELRLVGRFAGEPGIPDGLAGPLGELCSRLAVQRPSWLEGAELPAAVRLAGPRVLFARHYECRPSASASCWRPASAGPSPTTSR